MVKKVYQKPTVKAVQLQYQCQILAGSGAKTLQGSKGEGSEPDTWYELD